MVFPRDEVPLQSVRRGPNGGVVVTKPLRRATSHLCEVPNRIHPEELKVTVSTLGLQGYRGVDVGVVTLFFPTTRPTVFRTVPRVILVPSPESRLQSTLLPSTPSLSLSPQMVRPVPSVDLS